MDQEIMTKLNLKNFKVGIVWDEGGKSGIVQILISHGEKRIYSFQFAYVDQKGDVGHSRIHGKPDGLNFDTVTFDYPSEFLTSMSGAYEGHQLVAIAFGSNKRMYGPFGMTNTGDAPEFPKLSSIAYDKFNCKFGPRSSFAGFHGRVCGSFVSAIGIYIKPITSLAEIKSPVGDSHVNVPEPNKEQAVEPDPIDSLLELNNKAFGT